MASQTLQADRLLTDVNMPQGRICAIASGTAGFFSAPCPGKDTANEDALRLIPVDGKRAVLAVADGLGGQPAGDQASNLALKALSKSVHQAATDGTDLRNAILNGFENANRSVQSLGVGAATTLAVVELDGDVIRPYHAGDSSILLVGQRGRLRLQTVDHSPVGYALEAGMLDAGEAMHHEDRHVIFNMVGSDTMRIEVGPSLTMRPRDTAFVATDGVTDNLHVEEIVELIRKGPLDAACRTLAERCSKRMERPEDSAPSKPDDFSFIAFRLGSHCAADPVVSDLFDDGAA